MLILAYVVYLLRQTYSGVSTNPNEDPLTMEARRTMIKTYGQTPLQIFTEAHPLPFTLAFAHLNSVQALSKVSYMNLVKPNFDMLPVMWSTFNFPKNEETAIPEIQFQPHRKTSMKNLILIRLNKRLITIVFNASFRPVRMA